jgi:metal-sulfur cluster biosynthetic enzyme
MPDPTLKDKLIEKLKTIDDPAFLEEVANLFELQEPGSVYKVTEGQREAIKKGRSQVTENKLIDNSSADKEAEEWLNE